MFSFNFNCTNHVSSDFNVFSPKQTKIWKYDFATNVSGYFQPNGPWIDGEHRYHGGDWNDNFSENSNSLDYWTPNPYYEENLLNKFGRNKKNMRICSFRATLTPVAIVTMLQIVSWSSFERHDCLFRIHLMWIQIEWFISSNKWNMHLGAREKSKHLPESFIQYKDHSPRIEAQHRFPSQYSSMEFSGKTSRPRMRRRINYFEIILKSYRWILKWQLMPNGDVVIVVVNIRLTIRQ